MKEKILYFLQHGQEREKITKAAKKYARENFSHEANVKRLIRLIEQKL